MAHFSEARMSQPLSRRHFFALTGGALATPSLSWAARAQDTEDDDEVPPLLDHIILGCNDLDRGIDLVKEKTGVRATLGGVHLGRGTRNALLSLGERRYLEIIAPDSSQGQVVHFPQILGMTEPRLIVCAATKPASARSSAAPKANSASPPPRFALRFLSTSFFCSCLAVPATCYTLKPVPWRFCAVGAGLGLWGDRFGARCKSLAMNKAPKGGLSQNAASGRATAFALMNESGLARSG